MLDSACAMEAEASPQPELFGPKLPVSVETHQLKYRNDGESFMDAMRRQAHAMSDDQSHENVYTDIICDMRFLAGGRVQSSMGRDLKVCAHNCFVSGTIEDSFDDIMRKFVEAGITMRLGGGIGYDFSRLRPWGDLIKSLGTFSSGPLGFAPIFDAGCQAIASAGHRRGAQMIVLRVDHPDIEFYVRCKNNTHFLTAFNTSVGITDEFMNAVVNDLPFDLRFEGKVYKTIQAVDLWNQIMESTWDWAEPGVLFLDTINRCNNLKYCETISATNPCAEQPLPPYGACLLGSFNLTKYIFTVAEMVYFDWPQFVLDIPPVVRAMDNVIDRAIYPLPQQQREAQDKRRMGLGVTGLANAGEALGYPYGSTAFLNWANKVYKTLANESYYASAMLAKEKGAFPMFDRDQYMQSEYVARLDLKVRDAIFTHGIRNSHLTSIAPAGTISLTADNVSSGVEPVFSWEYDRKIKRFGGSTVERVQDYGMRVFGVKGKRSADCSIDDHLNVLLDAAYWMDSAVSKTLNVGSQVIFEDFKDIYMRAWRGGAKGCTTFRSDGKRHGILNEIDDDETLEACFIDPETGSKSCG